MSAVIANQDDKTAAIGNDAATAHPTPRLAGPDLLRAVAILLVMLWHLPRPARLPILQGLREYSWTGVDLFFVLSGYLIGMQLLGPLARGQPLQLAAFYLKRSLRILPAFWVVLAVYVFFPEAGEGSRMQPAWRFLTFTMNFGLDYTVTDTFTQAWSLCVEEHFYLLLPTLVLLLSRARSRAPIIALVVGILLGGMLLRAMLWMPLAAATAAEARHPFGPAYLEAIYYPSYCRLDALLCGVLLAAFRCFYPKHWQRYARPGPTLLLGLAAIILAAYLFHWPSLPFIGGPSLSLLGATLGYPLFAVGCACLLSASLHWEQWSPSWHVPGAAAIATISYSLYLSHKLTSHLTQRWLDPVDLRGISGLAIYFGSSIAVAAVLWVLVERPPLLLRNRLLKRQANAAKAGAEVAGTMRPGPPSL